MFDALFILKILSSGIVIRFGEREHLSLYVHVCMIEMFQNSIAVANFFIDKSKETGDEVTPMKLLKLVYIAHGWHLGLYDEPLIADQVEAWKFGPVVRPVYQAFKNCGSDLVTEKYGHKHVDASEHDFLNKIWDVYKKYTGIQLSTITHQPNTPWAIITDPYKNNHELPRGLKIPIPVITDYYKRLADAGESPRS